MEIAKIIIIIINNLFILALFKSVCFACCIDLKGILGKGAAGFLFGVGRFF